MQGDVADGETDEQPPASQVRGGRLLQGNQFAAHLLLELGRQRGALRHQSEGTAGAGLLQRLHRPAK